LSRLFIAFLILFPVAIYALSAYGVFPYTPFGTNFYPDTEIQFINNAIRAGSWLLIGWFGELIIIKAIIIIGDRLYKTDSA
jgi:hypothetical protein